MSFGSGGSRSLVADLCQSCAAGGPPRASLAAVQRPGLETYREQAWRSDGNDPRLTEMAEEVPRHLMDEG